MEPTPPRKSRTKRVNSAETEEGSVVAAVDKAVLLAMVDQLESEAALEEERKQQVLQIAHNEDVSRWIEAIAQWLIAIPSHCTSFAHLCQSLEMPQIEIWLGILLGEFELEQGEEFYSDMFWVKGTSADS
jgi:hypothetical protein